MMSSFWYRFAQFLLDVLLIVEEYEWFGALKTEIWKSANTVNKLSIHSRLGGGGPFILYIRGAMQHKYLHLYLHLFRSVLC